MSICIDHNMNINIYIYIYIYIYIFFAMSVVYEIIIITKIILSII